MPTTSYLLRTPPIFIWAQPPHLPSLYSPSICGYNTALPYHFSAGLKLKLTINWSGFHAESYSSDVRISNLLDIHAQNHGELQLQGVCSGLVRHQCVLSFSIYYAPFKVNGLNFCFVSSIGWLVDSLNGLDCTGHI